jgi:hypothetical protein
MLTISLLANVQWKGPPRTLGDSVLGDAGDAFIDKVNAAAGGRICVDPDVAGEWLRKDVAPRLGGEGESRQAQGAPVAIACWTVGQGRLGRAEVARRLEDIIGLVILLENDLQRYEVYRRGPTNRPGVRGLVIDRAAVDAGLKGSDRDELSYSPLALSEIFGRIETVEWFAAEALPLGALLEQDSLRNEVEASLEADPLTVRLRTAARWVSDAHYTLAADDVVLALGVSLDALLAGRQALPGRALADRYALLEPVPARRPARLEQHQGFYAARSSVAHGGTSSKVSDPEFVNGMFTAVRWAARRILELRELFKPQSDREVDRLFDDLRLGVRRWT